MKKIVKLIVLLYFATLSCAFADTPSKIVFFGDSLTDNGNLYLLSDNQIPNSPPYFKGRFSNGETWSDKLATYFSTSYNIPYKNYAFGGATVLNKDTDGRGFAPRLRDQVDLFLSESGVEDKSKMLFVIWIGSNDYFADEDIETFTQTVTNEIKDVMLGLIGKGAKNFLVLNLPDLSMCPLGKTLDFSSKLHLLSQVHNDKLNKIIAEIKDQNQQVSFHTIDIFSIFKNMYTYPEKFNEKYHTHLKNLSEPCFTGSYFPPSQNAAALSAKTALPAPTKKQLGSLADLTCADPDEYFFWDTLHPSAIAHDILAQIIIESYKQQA